LKDSQNANIISKELGSPYSFSEKLKMRGAGSTKAVYVKGIPSFQSIKNSGQDIDYVNFEVFPNGIVIRYAKGSLRNFILLKKDAIQKIDFESTKIKIKTKFGLKIVNEATIEFKLNDDNRFLFYVPVIFYKSMKYFWTKDWLSNVANFKTNKAKAKVDSNNIYLDIIACVLRLN